MGEYSGGGGGGNNSLELNCHFRLPSEQPSLLGFLVVFLTEAQHREYVGPRNSLDMIENRRLHA